jgi:serine/threonine-protein kinase
MGTGGSEGGVATLGKYQLIAELGHGGMAEVFLALAQGPAGFNKLVVVKQIRPQLGEDPDFLSMFLDEARLAARLNHPNVVQTNEVGEDDGRYFICMEYLEGQPFNRVLAKLAKAAPGEGLSLAMQLRVLVDSLAGLHHAHELCDFDGTPLAVVHRDMSPHNIFVTYAGQVKVVDFGIAKALSSSSETRTGVLKGKVGYMAPEQALGEKVDRRADVFSAGMILWEILAGRRMFKGVADVAILQQIVHGTLPSPRSVVPDLDPRLEAICMKAIARRREERHETAAELAADIEAVIDLMGEKASMRDAGKLLDRAFAADRIKIKALVESTLANARSSPAPLGGRITGVGSRPRPLPLIESPATESFSGAGSIRGLTNPGGDPTRITGSGPGGSLTANLTSAPTAPSNGGRARLLAAGAAVAVIAAAAMGIGLSRKTEAARPATSASPATLRTLRVESSPAGAVVSEGATELGRTPLAIPLDPAVGTRHIVVSLEGYLPYAIDQVPAAEDVRVLVPLAKVAAAPAVPAPTTAAAPPSAEPQAPKPKAPPPRVPAPPPPGPKPPPSDINMQR